MNRFIVILISFFAFQGIEAYTISPKLSSSIHKLEKLNVIDGEAVSYGGVKGEFYKLYEFFIANGHEKDFLFMLESTRPTVRTMGALCLIQKDKTKYKKKIETLFNDTEPVDFAPGGCIVQSMHVGTIVKLFIKNPNLLNRQRKHRNVMLPPPHWRRLLHHRHPSKRKNSMI